MPLVRNCIEIEVGISYLFNVTQYLTHLNFELNE